MMLGQLLPNLDLEGSHNNLAWTGENEISQAKKSHPIMDLPKRKVRMQNI